tara:strand:+ start:190 stop:399 length:210 start_codon:yes stop_codon:yes gene_type:complete
MDINNSKNENSIEMICMDKFNKDLFDKMSYDVSNGFGRKDLKKWYGEENVKLYLEYGEENDLFEGELEG